MVIMVVLGATAFGTGIVIRGGSAHDLKAEGPFDLPFILPLTGHPLASKVKATFPVTGVASATPPGGAGGKAPALDLNEVAALWLGLYPLWDIGPSGAGIAARAKR